MERKAALGKGPTRGSMGKWEVTESWLPRECRDHLYPPAGRCQSHRVFLPGSQFWVTVQRTEAAERCGLHGSYVLRVEAEKLTLLTAGTQSQILEPLLSWPYTLLRRYGRDKVGVLAWKAGFLGLGLRAGWAGREVGSSASWITLLAQEPTSLAS